MKRLTFKAFPCMFFIAGCLFADSAFAQPTPITPGVVQDQSGNTIAIPWGDTAPWNAMWGYGAPWNWNYGMPWGYGPPWYYANPTPAPIARNYSYRTIRPPLSPSYSSSSRQPSTGQFVRRARDVKWPKTLLTEDFKKEREEIDKLAEKEGWSARGIKLLAWRMKLKLTDKVREIDPEDYDDAKEFLTKLEKNARR